MKPLPPWMYAAAAFFGGYVLGFLLWVSPRLGFAVLVALSVPWGLRWAVRRMLDERREALRESEDYEVW